MKVYEMNQMTQIFGSVSGFEWDKGNIDKNWEKHHVAYVECEELLLSGRFILSKDTTHSATEDRYQVLGRTDEGRILFLSFTLRGDKVRVITARDASKKERKTYEEAEKSANL